MAVAGLSGMAVAGLSGMAVAGLSGMAVAGLSGMAVAGLLTEPRWLGQETGHNERGCARNICD
ncbi:MAG: hypothetical protein CVU38_06360 [Chloroflexi bacterium HGW-Chloroflexi-1]|nr:MAG: hypothetical protein CVU38_06360 [Chloroflexi bacterium HGW-Chloroflexi-1]